MALCGNDTIEGKAGNDLLNGGEGFDFYELRNGFGQDIIDDDSGGDQLRFTNEYKNVVFMDVFYTNSNGIYDAVLIQFSNGINCAD